VIDFSQYKVSDLKEELQKRGLKRSGKKTDLVACLTKTVANESFTPFLKLADELRSKVWNYASAVGRRVIEMSAEGNQLPLAVPALTDVPNIMLTSKEAYKVVARCYKPRQFNYHDDVFYIDDIVSTTWAMDEVRGPRPQFGQNHRPFKRRGLPNIWSRWRLLSEGGSAYVRKC